MKEYKVIDFFSKEVFPNKGLFGWNYTNRAKRLEEYLNEKALSGWTVKSSSGFGSPGASNVIIILERDKPEGEASEPTQE